MIIDYSQTTVVEGIVQFPDYTFITQPLAPDQIGETVVIQGTNTGVSTSVGATANSFD